MKKVREIFLKSVVVSSIISLFLIVGIILNSKTPVLNTGKSTTVSQNVTSESQDVLGRYSQAPQIYIYGSNQQYATGGMIPLASTDEPAVQIGGYQVSGTAQVSLYKADLNSLLSYLTHDDKGEQLVRSMDVSKLEFVTTVNQEINTGNSSSTKVTLPLSETGIWYLDIKVGSTQVNAFIIRSNIGIITDQGDNQFIFWGQDYKTKRGIDGGSVTVLNLKDGVNTLQTSSFDGSGLAYASMTADADIALIQKDDDYAIIPLNLKYLNYGYNYKEFQVSKLQTKYFIFTDRPIYKPGDTVYFKAILRNDDDARYTIPGGSVQVKIFGSYYYESSNQTPLYQNTYSISGDGTVNGQYKIPVTSKVGSYSLYIDKGDGSSSSYDSSTYFDVQYYQKPEYFIEADADNSEVVAGDKIKFTISGSYFSGQPLSGQEVTYSINSSDIYEYSYFNDLQYLARSLDSSYGYDYYGNSNSVSEGVVTLGKDGRAEITVDSKVDFNNGKSQVFSLTATLENRGIAPSYASKNVLVRSGEFGIYRKEGSYGSKINQLYSLPVVLAGNDGNVKVSGINLTAKIHRTNWVARTDPNQKYPTYEKEEEDLASLSAKTDATGNVTFSFTPTKVGSYTITVSGNDSRGNTISKEFYSWVTAEDYAYSVSSNETEITLTPDKETYLPTDTIHFNIFSTTPDRDIFLALERGRVQRFQVVRLTGKVGTVDIPLTETDMPNVYATAYSFSSYRLDSSSVNIPVSPQSKKVLISLTPDSDKYGPGDTATINVSTTDYAGNPISADVALWTVDKAIFELVSSNLGDIFEKFWDERYNSTHMAHSLEGILANQSERGGGCFAADTKVLMASSKLKNIEDVKVGDKIITKSENGGDLVKAKVTGTHVAEVDGYLIINGNLRITTYHILNVNGSWQEAGSIKVGDKLIGADGNEIIVTSIEWQMGKFEVYNLEIDNYHTFFADGVWVHNQKGGPREIFKDTAYWNPSLHTDSSGHAKINFKLPDNLTTWVLAAVADTTDTKVGQTTKDIVVTKDLIVRPILPNILRTGDSLVLSALIQNSTEQGQDFDIGLAFDSGDIEEASIAGVAIDSSEIKQLYWNIQPTKESDAAKLTFSAKSTSNKNLTDTIISKIPIRPFGFYEKTASAGENDKIYQVKMASDADMEKSSVVLSLSPTITGTLPLAMKYLIDYPYGCVEQTTSRFVPAVIAKANPTLFAEALEGKDVDDMIEKGVTRLANLQLYDGGWPWWSSGRSDTFLTAYVTEYLLQAKSKGITVDEYVLDEAKSFLEKETYYDSQAKKETNYGREDRIVKNYGLVLLGDTEKVKKVTDYDNLTPDLLAINVMTNYMIGDRNPGSNGLTKLISMAQTQGDAVYWEDGSRLNFGSKDTSTALVVRALVMTGGDNEIATKAVRYLTRNRQSDYWSNTFATAQVVRALTDYSKTVSGLNPNYSYKVELDGKQIATGTVTSINQKIKDISLPVDDIKKDGSNLTITKSGEGTVYSTLAITDFHTDRNSAAVDHGLKIKREYVNEKGDNYTLGVGSVVKVNLTVSGLKTDENYAVISDELPAGMVPVNETLDNERYGQSVQEYYYNVYGVTDRDITENGIVLSIYRLGAGERTFSYRARIVNEGTFTTPPATVSLMYAPEIYGRTSAEVVQIGKEAVFIPGKALVKSIFSKLIPAIAAIVFIIAAVIVIILKKKGKIFNKGKNPPKDNPPVSINPPVDLPPPPQSPPVEPVQPVPPSSPPMPPEQI